MPEMWFTVRWPDGSVDDCYSPSLVVHDHLEADTTYPVSDFLERSLHALELASERVRASYGHACSSAAATSAQLRDAAARFTPEEPVEVLRMQPPLPRGGAS